MNLVCFGQQNWDVCWTAKQQWASRLAARGHRVLYVDPDPARGAGLRRIGPGALHVLTHPPLSPFAYRAQMLWRRRRTAVVARRLLPGAKLAVALRPDVGRALDALAPDAIVYYAVDEWTAFGGQDDATRAGLRAAEDALLRRADLVLAVSPGLCARFRTAGADAELAPNGADVEHFAPRRLAAAPLHPALADVRGPCVGFVGQIDERFDAAGIAELAARRPDWTFVLAGRVLDRAGAGVLADRPNVRLLGYVAYDDLPGVLRRFDVCTLPYRDTALTRACQPLKVFEYLATGRPVVAVPLPGLGAAREVVRIADGVDAFEVALAAALADPGHGRPARLAVAARAAWDVRVDALERRFEAALAATTSPRVRGVRLATLPEPAEGFHEYGRSAAAERPSWRERLAALVARVRLPRRGLRRVLVARQGQLGDLCVLVPAVRELRRRLPDAEIVLGAADTPAVRLLFDGLVDAIRDPARAVGSRGRLREHVAWVRARYDAVLTGPGYLTPREVLRIGAPRRVGVYDGHPLQRWLTDAEPLARRRHEVATNLRLVARLTGAPVDVDQPFRLDLPRVDDAALRARLGVPSTATLIVVHPGAAKPSRRWPTRRFGAVVDRLLAADPARVAVVTGVAAEAPLAEALRDAVAPARRTRLRSAVGATDVAELAALLRGAALLLANDTGVTHLARGLGVPVTAVLGPDEPRRWGPAPDGPGPATALRAAVPCAPCARVHCEALYCMRTTTVAAVAAAAAELLGDPGHDRTRVAGAPAGDDRAAHTGAPATALDLRERRVDFAQLAALGFALPRLAVVFAPGPHAAAGSDVARQTWPGGEVVAARAVVAGERWRARCAAPEPAAILAATDAELLLCVPAGVRLAPGAVAEHVAALLRRPDADRATDRGARGPRPTLVRREWLAAGHDPWSGRLQPDDPRVAHVAASGVRG